MYAVHLPNPEQLPPNLRVKFFRAHETYEAYLRVWFDLGYAVTWPDDGRVAVIGSIVVAA